MLLIGNSVMTSKVQWRPLWKNTLHKVLQERGGFINGRSQGYHSYREIPKIRITHLDNRMINGHSILGWILRSVNGWDTVLSMVVNTPAEYPEPDEDEVLNNVLQHQSETNNGTLPCTPQFKTVLPFCRLLGEVRHLKWWLTKHFADYFNNFYMYRAMSNKEHTEMQLQFQESPNLSVFVTTPKVSWSGLRQTAANYAVITLKIWVFN